MALWLLFHFLAGATIYAIFYVAGVLSWTVISCRLSVRFLGVSLS